MIKEQLKKKAEGKGEMKEDNLLDMAITDEQDGVEMYGKLAASCKDPKKKKIYSGIQSDEKRHLALLDKIKGGEKREEDEDDEKDVEEIKERYQK